MHSYTMGRMEAEILAFVHAKRTSIVRDTSIFMFERQIPAELQAVSYEVKINIATVITAAATVGRK